MKKPSLFLLLSACCLTATLVTLAKPIRSSSASAESSYADDPIPYDAEVAYLESTGSQLIETNIPDFPLLNRVEAVFSLGSASERHVGLLGSTTYSFNYISFRYASRIYYYGNRGATTPMLPCSVGDVHIGTYEYDGKALLYSLDGEYATYTTTLVSQGGALYLFGARNSSLSGFVGRIYGVRVVEKGSGDILADLVPVRFTNLDGEDEGAMYDKISGRMFANSGSGSFLIGPDKE